MIDRKIKHFVLLLLVLSSCDEVIDVDLEPAAPALVVDAFVNNLNQEQRVSLFFSQDYIDESPYVPAQGATVSISESSSEEVFVFAESSDSPGLYTWQPTSQAATLGQIGADYTLRIAYEGNTYTAFSSMNRVPAVDSILFTDEEGLFGSNNFYQAEFYARDFVGEGDTYWIKSFRNDAFLNKPSEINLAYDAGPNAGTGIDGITFAPPLRININPIGDEDADGNLITYNLRDLVKVEIHSITNSAHDYMTQLATQTNRPGGFQELFSVPQANLPSNITIESDEAEIEPLGFFSVSAVSSREVIFAEDLLRDD